ncbi:hypothetical protein CH380_20200 [Leptospira adleri]|uniref:Uncharacterized protein n=1 Tax=Leptospira adleri TaxID=2023186 RepID=A0A2M9YIQ3_9LEPT|nr:hypothetical protein CH380_20200 [Leptospira adleri]PJZ63277.1 hypothetical protein CH376_03285 [Leptospira adleri]
MRFVSFKNPGKIESEFLSRQSFSAFLSSLSICFFLARHFHFSKLFKRSFFRIFSEEEFKSKTAALEPEPI